MKVKKVAVTSLSLAGSLLIFQATFLAAEEPVPAVLRVVVSHETMETRIGYPAIIAPGDGFPSMEITSNHHSEGVLTGVVVRRSNGAIVARFAPQKLLTDSTVNVEFTGTPEPGRYSIPVWFEVDGETVFRDRFHFSVFDPETLPGNYSRIVHPGADGRLVYVPDYRGNRIPDFSHAGYMGGGVALPNAPVRVSLRPEPGDNRERIQAAIDQVSAMTPDADGIRGAVLLRQGVYEIRGDLRIATSGVVLRGEGAGGDPATLWSDPEEWMNPDQGRTLDDFKNHLAGRNATVLIRPGRATRNLILIQGGGITSDTENAVEIIDNYVPVGTVSFSVEDSGRFQVGDKIMVRRRGNPTWITEIGMDRIPGKGKWGGSQFFEYDFERKITNITGNLISIDSPIVFAIEKRWGGGSVFKYEYSARITQAGVEGMRLLLHDKLRNGRLSHMRGTAVHFNNARDVWARDVVAEHFYDRVFVIGDGKNITVRDSSVLMASNGYFSGYVPRYGFFPRGNASHVLVQNCDALHNRHAYVICAWVKGPNVFHNNVHHAGITWSEPHHRWSCGALFDNVHDDVGLMNRLSAGSGHGWSAANCVAWNTRGELVVQQPPTAQNWAIGHVGRQGAGRNHAWNREQFGYSDGFWELHRVTDRISLDPERVAGIESVVEASSYDWGRGPESTLDDSPDKYWLVQGTGEWIQYDLGRQGTIKALNISFPQFGGRLMDRVYSFDIQTSNDRKEWKTVYADAKGPAKGPEVFHRYKLTEAPARYVRIVAKGSNLSRDGSPGSVAFHMQRIRFEPRPAWDAKEVRTLGVKPASLFLRQLQDRLSR